MRHIKTLKDIRNVRTVNIPNFKKYVVVDFGDQGNARDKYYVLRTHDYKPDEINYDKFYYIENDKLISFENNGTYSSLLDVIYQTNIEQKAIEKLKELYTVMKFNL